MKSPSLVLRVLVVLGALTVPAPALADPIAITGGFLSSQGLSSIGVYQLSGAGLSIGGNTEMGNVEASMCFPCPAGTRVSLSSLILGRLETDPPAIIGGAEYSGVIEATFDFDGPDVVIPGRPADFTVQRSFTFTGVLRGTDIFGHDTLFRHTLVGQGQVTANFAYNPNLGVPPHFEFTSIRYDFADAAPVPEPVTMLLVGTGLGGVFVRYRKRRSLAD